MELLSGAKLHRSQKRALGLMFFTGTRSHPIPLFVSAYVLPLRLYVNIKSRLSVRLNSLSIFGARLWNFLRPDLRKLRKKPFKNKIHQSLLAVLTVMRMTMLMSQR